MAKLRNLSWSEIGGRSMIEKCLNIEVENSQFEGDTKWLLTAEVLFVEFLLGGLDGRSVSTGCFQQM